MEKTIKYLENGEYHYATVRAVGDLAQLKTDSKEDLVSAINDLFENSTDPDKAPKPEGYDQLVKEVADVIKGQQDLNEQWDKWQENDVKLTEERKQEYLQNIKSLQDSIDKAKEDASALTDKTNALSNQLTQTFSELDTSIQNMHDQLQKEAESISNDLNKTKGDLANVRTDLQNTQLDNGKIHDSISNINGKFEHKVWEDDLAPMKEQINRNETEVQQTKNQLLEKASQKSVDTLTNAVSNLDTQVKKTAQGLEVTVKKDELGGEIADALNNKTNLLLGTRSFSGEDNWRNRDKVTIEPGYYKGMKTAAVQVTDASIYQPYRVKANTAYTFSFFGKEDRDNPKATLVIKPIDAQNVNVDGGEQQVHITTEWQRFAVTFSVDQECEISIQIIQGPEANNNILHLAGFKLQYGQNNTPWEPNEADVAENIEHTESQFNVYSDQIAGIVKKQEKMGDTERQLDTRITETAEGLKQTSKDLQDANGKITEFKGQLESTARGLKTEYEKYTNDAIGQISDSSLNLIRNSAFQNKDDNFAQWQNVSAKANIREDGNGLRWVELTQSGMTTDNPQGITSNYFVIKQGKVTVAVDIKLGDKANLDNQNILLLELYNDAKQRVDFTDVSLEQLGLSTAILNDHNVHRGLYRLGIDRKDVKYMTVKAILHRNGNLWFTNFSARLSSIDDGGYTPNPDDVNQQILKQNTKIEQNAKEVAIKANSVDVTRDIKSAVDGIQVGGRNLLLRTSTTEKSGKSYDFAQYSIAGGLQPGTTYTMSGWARVDQKAMDNKQNVFVCAYTSDWSWSGWLNIAGSLTAKYNEITFTTPTGKSFSPVVTIYLSHPNNDNSKDSLSGIGFISRLKLEEGNKATSWTPSPEDVSEEIKSSKDAAIKVASDQIDIHVNELSTSFDDKLNKRVNEVKTASEKFTSDGIEQTVKKITDVRNDVNSIGDSLNKTGSRNLLHNTSDQYQTLTGSDWMGVHTSSEEYTSVSDYHTGDWFTYAATITNTSDVPVALQVWRCDKGNNRLANGLLGISPLVQPGQVNVRVSLTGRIDVETWNLQSAVYSSAGQVGQHTIQVKDERLVEGRLAGSWSPNPDDINKKIDTQTLDSANIDALKTQGHYFVKNLTGNPIGGWVYVDVTGNNNDRVRQDVYADQNNQHKYRSWNGARWSDWEQGAYLSDVNSAKTEVTASVKNLGDRVTTEVNSITKRVNSINGGGVNLLRGTADFRPDNIWFPLGLWTRTNEAYNGLTIFKDHEDNDWYGLTQYYPVKTGETYTFSLYARYESGSGSSTLLIMLNGDPENGHKAARVSPVTRDITLNEDWQRYSFTFTVNSDGYIKPRIERTSNNKNVLEICGFKLERGPVATPWTPAPEDAADQIKQLNTKWEVANGQIQGKVTETDVNNILNGKGYVTQSWAQTMFQMKSDSITLQTVRDNITNGIQNQVNGINNKIDTQTLDSADINNMRTQGHYFVRNLANSPISGWVYVDITGNNNDRLKQDVYQDSGYEHRSRRWFDNSWTEWTTDVNNKNVISQINITPESLKIASNKIEIDGNTYIHGTLNVPEVKLQGKKGLIDLSGDSGIGIKGDNGSELSISSQGLDLRYKQDFQMKLTRSAMNLFYRNEILKQEYPVRLGYIGTEHVTDDPTVQGLSLVYDPGDKDGKWHGADSLFLSYYDSKERVSHPQIELNKEDINHDKIVKKKGITFRDNLNLQSEQIVKVDGARDPLLINATNFTTSLQPDYYQPTVQLGYSNKIKGDSGVHFTWNSVKPFGRVDMTDASIWIRDAVGELRFGWLSEASTFNGAKMPAIYMSDGKGGAASALAFYWGSIWDFSTGVHNITAGMLKLGV